MQRPHESNGCSPPNAPAPNSPVPTQAPPTSHNPCAEVLESGPAKGTEDEAIEVHGRADHRCAARAGMKTADICRKHGISEATFYKWKARYGGLEVSEAKRLRTLEDENGRLKRMLADAMLDNAALKDLLGKKW